MQTIDEEITKIFILDISTFCAKMEFLPKIKSGLRKLYLKSSLHFMSPKDLKTGDNSIWLNMTFCAEVFKYHAFQER